MLGLMGVFFDDNDVLKLLRAKVKSAGGQVAFAKQTGVDRAYLNRVLNSRVDLGSTIPGTLNLRIAYTLVERLGRTNPRALDDDDVRKLLHSRVESAGGQSAFARQTGVDRAHLNRVLKGMRPPTLSILDALNLRIVYAPSSTARAGHSRRLMPRR